MGALRGIETVGCVCLFLTLFLVIGIRAETPQIGNKVRQEQRLAFEIQTVCEDRDAKKSREQRSENLSQRMCSGALLKALMSRAPAGSTKATNDEVSLGRYGVKTAILAYGEHKFLYMPSRISDAAALAIISLDVSSDSHPPELACLFRMSSDQFKATYADTDKVDTNVTGTVMVATGELWIGHFSFIGRRLSRIQLQCTE